MVQSFLFSALLLSGIVYAAPSPANPDGDSSLGEEVAVSAPFGIPMSDTVELAQQIGTAYVPAATMMMEAPAMTMASRPMAEPSMAEPPMVEPPMAEPSMAEPPMVKPPKAEPSMVMYGSGSSSWNNMNGLQDCVQQCMARFGPGSGGLTPPTPTEGGSVGGGATHTVIVAPSQGVLRYVPFAVNASVGDTISFQWRANNHYVARSSALHPCNGTQDATFFNSGKQNASFIFNQVVNDTNPVFYFCATGTHCQQGMFGIINPPVSSVADTTLGSMMTQLAENNTGLAQAWAMTNQKTEGTNAFGWGNNLDMASMPEWSHALMAENMLYNRQFLAANPEVLGENGDVDMSQLRGPMSVPADISAAALAASPTAATTLSLANPAAATAGAGAPAASAAGAVAPPTAAMNGARSLGSSSSLVAIVAVLATVWAL